MTTQTETILAGDRADALSVPDAERADYVRRLVAHWEGEADRLVQARSSVSHQDLYRLRARELRREFSQLSA